MGAGLFHADRHHEANTSVSQFCECAYEQQCAGKYWQHLFVIKIFAWLPLFKKNIYIFLNLVHYNTRIWFWANYVSDNVAQITLKINDTNTDTQQETGWYACIFLNLLTAINFLLDTLLTCRCFSPNIMGGRALPLCTIAADSRWRDMAARSSYTCSISVVCIYISR